jgi:Preprotein translocase subunit SecB
VARREASESRQELGDIGVTPVDDLSVAQQLAARLAGMTDIRDVRLLKTFAEIVSLPVEHPFLVYDLNSEAAVEYEPGGESFVVRGTYRLFIKSTSNATGSDSDRPASAVANIEFEHAALFVMNIEGREPPRAEELNAYAVSTGQFALYPYVREYISNLTTRLGLPPLTVGVLKLPVDASNKDKL